MMKRKLILIIAGMAILSSCNKDGWTKEELNVIGNQTAVMKVLTIQNEADSAILRQISRDIPPQLLGGDAYKTLSNNLLTTVTDPSQDGVGIAAPQVGISRRVVAVQRFDKPQEPFEVYPNIRITARRGDIQPGREGCLSVPDLYGEVLRSRDIDIAYTSTKTLCDTTETVEGFTAVIFQHECDHLDGIIYTDRISVPRP